MIITRTPYRISLFGGGTDFPAWYRKSGGQVISFTINKFCYLSVRELPPFFEHKYRIVYSKVEETRHLHEIRHPAVREILNFKKVKSGMEIQHHGDLPARSGVGSSSAFAVGLLHAVNIIEGEDISAQSLAKQAIFIEQEVLSEIVGSQDQIACAYGGINKLTFFSDGEWEVNKLEHSESLVKQIQDRAVLVYTGINRISSDISRGIFENFEKKSQILEQNSELVDRALQSLSKNESLDSWGELLAESWNLKTKLNSQSTNNHLEEFRAHAEKCGAIGWKILGAGGGGFFLFWLKENDKMRFLNDFKLGIQIPFEIEFEGSQSLNSNFFHRVGYNYL